jgi:ABC-2 type transport system permease protein
VSKVWAVFVREVRGQLVSPTAWILATAFLLLAGFFFFNLVLGYAAALADYETYAQITSNPSVLERVNLNEMIVVELYRNLLVVLLFVIPALTMRSFAEERKQGTDELILTSPVTPGQVVAGKFAGLAAVALALVALTGFFLAVLWRYGNPEFGPAWTGLVGLALAALAFTALGTAISALTENQVVAAIGSFVVFLMLFVADWPAQSTGGALRSILRGLSLPAHFASFGTGQIASPDVVYFLSLVALGLFAARAVLASQRFR